MENTLNLMLLALALGLMFLVLSRGRRQQRAIQQIQATLAPGREVMTASGMYGRVVEVRDDVVVLETSPGQQSRWARQAIARVIEEPAQDPDRAQDPAPPKDPAPPQAHTDEG